MKRLFSLALCLSLVALGASFALAAGGDEAVARDYSGYNLAIGGQNLIQSSTGIAGMNKAIGDTFYIYGGPGTAEGKFQQFEANPGGAPDAQNWTTHDLTEVAPHWRSTNNQALSAAGPSQFTGASGTNHAVASNHPGPGYVGYGNQWNDWLVFTYDVSAGNPAFDPAVDVTTVSYTCEYKHFSENGYDFTHFLWNQGGADVELFAIDGSSVDTLGVYTAVTFNSGTITYNPGDYVGNGNEIQLKITTTSDGGWSDEDGLFPTGGLGHTIVDNIQVKVNGTVVSVADFETTDGNPHDNPEGDVSGTNNGAGTGTAGWTPTPAAFFGDFAKLYGQFQDIDVCRDNFTPLWTFINDGTPPTNAPSASIAPAISPNWSYGVPGGFVVEYNGGLNGGEISNEVWSPPFAWDLPGTADDVSNGGAVLGYTRWSHMPLANGIFAVWHVRSYTAANGWTGWQDNNFVYYSATGAWGNFTVDVTDMLLQNPDSVQIAMGVLDLHTVFGFPGGDATPAPLYDNVYFKKYVIGGPVLSTRTIDLASDGFPVDGSKTGSVRFDANIDKDQNVLVPGDSITVDVTAVIPGTTVDFASIKMQVAHLVNPDFAAARANGLALVGATLFGTDPQTGWDIYTYSVQGDSTFTSAGGLVTDRYNFDLPDGTGNAYHADEDSLIFGGDVIHYYIEATDNLGNTQTLPSDIAGFTDFTEGTQYSRVFTVRALPTIVGGSQPTVLFWNDFGHRGGENEYLQAFRQNGMIEGQDYDTYTTKGPSSGVGNGLGSAGFHGANGAQLDGYDCLIYVAGDLSKFTISDGTGAGTNDFSNDVGTLEAWINQASATVSRHAAFFGDDIGESMDGGGATTTNFLNNVMGVTFVSADVGPKIDNQTSPVVASTGNDPSFVSSFVAYGGCLVINDFDELAANGAAPVMTHRFTKPGGLAYSPDVPAAFEWYREAGVADGVNDIFTNVFPYDLLFVRNDLNLPGNGTSARAQLLAEIFASWGKNVGGPAIGTSDLPKKLVVKQNFPNPFNPSTTIKFALPAKGQVSVKVYNVKGALVTTLVDGVLDAGEHSVIWNGKDAHGAPVSTGVYLYKVHTQGSDVVKKMALIK